MAVMDRESLCEKSNNFRFLVNAKNIQIRY